jgi:hypothetical protein
MNPWNCALLITGAGAIGGAVNALLTDGGIVTPRVMRGIFYPGFITNIFIGALSAFSSWAFYGSGAGINIANISDQSSISLHFSALAGAFFVGVAGSKWLASEVDKKLFKESVKMVGAKSMPPEACDKLVQGSALQILERVEKV